MYSTRLFFRENKIKNNKEKGSKVLSIFQDQHMAANTLGGVEHLQLTAPAIFIIFVGKESFSRNFCPSILNIFENPHMMCRSFEIGKCFSMAQNFIITSLKCVISRGNNASGDIESNKRISPSLKLYQGPWFHIINSSWILYPEFMYFIKHILIIFSFWGSIPQNINYEKLLQFLNFFQISKHSFFIGFLPQFPNIQRNFIDTPNHQLCFYWQHTFWVSGHEY